ncbi:MAG: hypothetical protein H8E34_10390 [Bacteroidetes bacterium]|nr:hypothetical protein [Bacteroidota bacterium]
MENYNLKQEGQCAIHDVSNSAICSGCNKPQPTVNRYMFDGLCADCTDKALYDYDFAKKAQARNEELIGHCC